MRNIICNFANTMMDMMSMCMRSMMQMFLFMRQSSAGLTS